MITPGWRRRNNSCPQCHMSGQVCDRYESKGILHCKYVNGKSVMIVVADICDQCGVLYASRAEAEEASVI